MVSSKNPRLRRRQTRVEIAIVQGQKIMGWLKQGWSTVVDPERKVRIRRGASLINKMLSRQKRDFILPAALVAAHVEPDDREDVCQRVYEECVDRAWRDLELSEAEKRTLDWLASVLELSHQEVRRLHTQKGTEIFGNLLAQAIADGSIDANERQRLQSVANWTGTTVRDLVRQSFASTGAGFLRGIFTTAIEDGVLLHEEWRHYLESARSLGFTQSEAKDLIQPYAQPFVEHVLADAKADGKLSVAEDQALTWLLDQFTLPASFREYVSVEVHDLKVLTNIAEGRLPLVDGAVGIELRAGEIPHFRGAAEYTRERQRKSGVTTDSFGGALVITDVRAVFSSSLMSFALNHSSVIGFRTQPRKLEVRSGAKGAGNYAFGDNARIAVAIWKMAVARANQTAVEKVTGLPTRHISRDVRQRVWQRYGGLCAECRSDQYLEFDHIIPVAKGGSNSDDNVQLLCRRCNLKKRDRI